jgi:hypothetical protein
MRKHVQFDGVEADKFLKGTHIDTHTHTHIYIYII